MKTTLLTLLIALSLQAQQSLYDYRVPSYTYDTAAPEQYQPEPAYTIDEITQPDTEDYQPEEDYTIIPTD